MYGMAVLVGLADFKLHRGVTDKAHTEEKLSIRA
jgi:hypothetical protein